MNKFGTYTGHGYALTYQIGEAEPAASLTGSGRGTESDGQVALSARRMGAYYYWPAGANNDDPDVCAALIKGNRLLPSLIEKQVAILYGTGPMLFREETGDDGTVSRRYIQDPEVQAWLEGWKRNGLPDSYKEYLIKCIRSYYYSEGIFSQWQLTRGTMAHVPGTLPVAGLRHISELRARLATAKDISRKTDVVQSDFDCVLVGNWGKTTSTSNYDVYPKFNPVKPLQCNGAISYSRNADYDNDIYATNVFFNGVRQWIIGCNATPYYINSFLENALSARHHIIIPNAWYNAKKEALEELCQMNAEKKAGGAKDGELITVKVGSETLEIGTEYSEMLLEKYVNLELRNLTSFLAGRGKNQGKTYATRSFMNENGDIEQWKIEEIPQKYKEYIEALISVDKRADMVLLSAKGIDPSISNITSDGTISKSGSDAYYNYIIYLTQQAIPDSVVCADLNEAIALNFPEKYAEGIRIGFHRPAVQRQEDVSPANRMANQNEQ